MLILAFDTATDVATSALVGNGEVLGERVSHASTLLEEIDALLSQAGLVAADLDALAVGTGPGSFTGTRIGLSVAQGLALALDIPVEGISTLAALGAAADGVLPVIDARRGEVFVPGPQALAPEDVPGVSGITCIGNGACRYRRVLEAAGAVIPPDESPLHLPWARLHAGLARAFGPAAALEPVYGREPDARRAGT